MARITNSPNETLQFDLERRKSFAFRLVLLTEDEQALANDMIVEWTEHIKENY